MIATAEIVPTASQDELPEGWTLKTIEDLVGDDGVFVDGDWVESKDQDPEGDVRLIQLADIGDGEYRDRSARFLTHAKAIELGCTFLMKNDVLIARMPDPLGRACVFPGDTKAAVTVVDVAIVRSSGGEFNHRWLMYFINAPAVRSAVAAMQSGSTRKRISRGNLAKIALPVPPVHQQAGIVAEIEKQFSRLDEAVANLNRVKANLKRYKAAVLKAAVEGRLVETEAELARREDRTFEGGERQLRLVLDKQRRQSAGTYKLPVSADSDALPNLPEGWTWATPAQLAAGTPYSLSIGPFGSNLRVADYTDAGVPLVFVSDIRRASFGRADTNYVSERKADELHAHRVEGGDLLVTKMGDPPGDVAVYPHDRPPAVITADCIRLKLSGLVVPRFFAYAIQSELVRRQILAITKGVAQLKVSLQRFRSIGLPLPPFEEQHRIVLEVDRRLSHIQKITSLVSTTDERAGRLRTAILRQAFSDHGKGKRAL